MPREPRGTIIEKRTTSGDVVFAARFPAYGERQYVTLGAKSEDMTAESARKALDAILVDVSRGVWVSPAQAQEAAKAAKAERDAMPTLAVYAAEWMDSHVDLRPNTIAAYEYELGFIVEHLGDIKVADLTVRDVDRFKVALLKSGRRKTARKDAPAGLTPTYVNSCLGKLSALMDMAVEHGLVTTNPAAGRRRRIMGSKFRRDYVETVEQARALLDAAGELGRRASRGRRHVGRRPIVAVMMLGGLRVHEVATLRWRDVSFARATIKVRGSKTDAGIRTVDMDPTLAGELRAWKARQNDERGDGAAYVFATVTGSKPGTDNIRNRVIRAAVDLANESLDDAEQLGNVTPHGLRVTFTSMMFEVGEQPAVVADQLGHESATTTMDTYTRVMRRKHRRPDEWAALLGREAGSGTSGGTNVPSPASSPVADPSDSAL